MPYALMRGENGRRHEVDFENARVRVEVYSSDKVVEIVVEEAETPRDGRPPRVVHLNLPCELFAAALAEAARGRSKLSLV